jgi:hypothetical protein
MTKINQHTCGSNGSLSSWRAARGTLPNGLTSVGAGLEKRICFAYPPHSERDDGCAMIDLWRPSESVAMTPRRETMAEDAVTWCDLEALWGVLTGGA